MPQSVDSRWLFELESNHFDTLGQRMDVAGLRRWSNPSSPQLRDGNHAAVGPDDGLIPDQLIQLFDAQDQDGTPRCVDVYGPSDDRDALCLQLGLQRSRSSALELVIFRRSRAKAPIPATDPQDRPAPPLVVVDPRQWVDTVTQVVGGPLPSWRREAVMAEAAIAQATFYGIVIGETAVACLARFDWKDASQITSVAVDGAFRKTGFAGAALSRAIHDAPHDRVFGLIAADNKAMLRVSMRAGAEPVSRDVRRRYIAAGG